MSSGSSLSNSNLRLTMNSSSHASARGTLGKTSGKWYTEINIVQVESGWPGGASPAIGICSERTDLTNPFNNGPDEMVLYANGPSNCTMYYNNAKSITYGTFFTAGAVIGIAMDLDNLQLEFSINGVAKGKLSMSTYSTPGHTFYPIAGSPYATGTAGIVDLASTSLTYSIPSGFSRW
ncbi:hypothetical protein [Burkholderia phage FLC6]|nr:hypothetical protein [Burkholderia phage FLC6]